MLLTGSSSTQVSKLISILQAEFSLKNLGSLHYFLGIEVTSLSHGLFLSQEKYIKELIHQAGMDECKPSPTPAAVPFSRATPPDTSVFHDITLYKSLVGSFQYITITRPEIAFAVNSACQAMHHPTNSNFAAVKHIIRYLQGSKHSGLLLQPSPLILRAFSDNDWATDPTDRCSIIGTCIFLSHNPVLWLAKKQHSVAKSSTEIEYKALALTSMDLTWLQMILHDLHISPQSPPMLHCDNVSAIALTANPIFHSRTKHIAIDYHFVREKVQRKEIFICYILSHLLLADLFTKSLSHHRFAFLKDKLMVRDLISLRGAY